MEFFRGRQWDIIGRTPLWFGISGAVILVGLISLFTRGLNYGIDFTGGSLYRLQYSSPLAESDAQVAEVIGKVRSALAPLNLATSQIQVVGDDRGQLTQLYLRTPPVANDEEAARRGADILAALRQALPDKGEPTDLGRETVGPVVGKELRNNAILAFTIGSLLIMIYITARYEFRFALAGIAALLHDALFTLGCMSLFQVELNSGFVAAILTILGYSINDSVVIFDRIRENMRLHRRANFAETVNRSLLETMARSINTVLTVEFSILALLFFGGEAIRPFALALLFGVTTGCYSSIFFASPLVVLWEGRAAQARARRIAGAGARASGQPSTARPRPAVRNSAIVVDDLEAAETEAAEGDGVASRAMLERLQQEELEERRSKLDAEAEQKRAERRERRRKEKERLSKRGGKPKRRF